MTWCKLAPECDLAYGVLAYTDDNEVKIWDLASGKQLGKMTLDTTPHHESCLHYLGRGVVLTKDQQGTCRIWDFKRWELDGEPPSRSVHPSEAKPMLHAATTLNMHPRVNPDEAFSTLGTDGKGPVTGSENGSFDYIVAEGNGLYRTSPVKLVAQWDGNPTFTSNRIAATHRCGLAITTSGRQVAFLQLHHGNRRVTLDEAEARLSSEPSRPGEDA